MTDGLTRRGFVKTTAAMAGSLALAWYPNARDVVVERPRQRALVQAPHLFQQVLARHDGAATGDEDGEDERCAHGVPPMPEAER